MKTLSQIIALIACFFCTAVLYGQNDFGVWTGLEINAPLHKDVKIGLQAETRFDNNVSRMKNAFLSPFLEWDVAKYFRVGVNYRLSSIPYNSTVVNRVSSHRYTLDLQFRNIIDLIVDKSKFGLSLRLRGTTEIEDQKANESYIRFRIKADYNVPKSKLVPYVAAEWFYHFNDQIVYTFDEVKTINSISKFRATLGLSYPIGKQHGLKIYSLYQQQLVSAKSDFIIGIGYAYKLKKGKKKADKTVEKDVEKTD